MGKDFYIGSKYNYIDYIIVNRCWLIDVLVVNKTVLNPAKSNTVVLLRRNLLFIFDLRPLWEITGECM